MTDHQEHNPLRGISIPAQPHIINAIKEAGDDLEKIAQLINQDPSIAASVLKIVNSAAFGIKSKIASIERAVMMLGIGRIKTLVNSQALQASLGGAEALEVTRFWDGANDIAAICYLLAMELDRVVLPDDAYSLGLFHNCGIIMLAQKYEDYWQTLAESYDESHQGCDLISLEDIRYQSNHAVIGYYIAKSWKLPEAMVQVIRHHHDLDYIRNGSLAGAEATFELLAILKMAEHIFGLHKTLGHSAMDYEWLEIQASCLESVALSEYEFEELSDLIHDKMTLE